MNKKIWKDALFCMLIVSRNRKAKYKKKTVEKLPYIDFGKKFDYELPVISLLKKYFIFSL